MPRIGRRIASACSSLGRAAREVFAACRPPLDASALAFAASSPAPRAAVSLLPISCSIARRGARGTRRARQQFQHGREHGPQRSPRPSAATSGQDRATQQAKLVASSVIAQEGRLRCDSILRTPRVIVFSSADDRDLLAPFGGSLHGFALSIGSESSGLSDGTQSRSLSSSESCRAGRGRSGGLAEAGLQVRLPADVCRSPGRRVCSKNIPVDGEAPRRWAIFLRLRPRLIPAVRVRRCKALV